MFWIGFQRDVSESGGENHERVFVTGGSGFIGTHLVRRLADTDHQVTCLVRRSSNTVVLKELGVELVSGDVTDSGSLREAIKGHDWVINLANVYSFWEPDPSVYRRVNVHGTRNVMELALAAGVPKVVHISTGGIYGKPEDAPFTDESKVGLKRFSRYFQTKYEGDKIAWDLHKSKKLPLVMIHPKKLGESDVGAVNDRCYPVHLLHPFSPSILLLTFSRVSARSMGKHMRKHLRNYTQHFEVRDLN